MSTTCLNEPNDIKLDSLEDIFKFQFPLIHHGWDMRNGKPVYLGVSNNGDGFVITGTPVEITNSIQYAIAETKRRRTKQREFNKSQGIKPKTIKKNIGDILESVYESDYFSPDINDKYKSKKSLYGDNLKKHIISLKKTMLEHATNLEFEDAAKIRDDIKKLETDGLLINEKPNKPRSTGGMPGTRTKKKKKLIKL